MKRTVFLVKTIGLALVCALALTACDDTLGNNNNKQPQKLTVGYLSNLMVDIGDATALGIAKRPVQESRSIRAVTDTTYTEEKNYLVKTTVDITNGNVEWDENGLTNVTFKKRTTETVVIPIYDEEGNLIGEEEVEDGQTVTQDEIPAQVNKLYVYNTYTFIQFVPDDTATISDTRPDDLGKPDRSGYYDYDKCDYYNDDLHQSFVIENSTGNIYSLADTVYIETIHNGLLKIKDSPYIWDCRIKDNDELEVFTLFQNTTVEVYDYYKDKYGNNYVFNDKIDQTISEINTIFFINPEYHVASSGEVLYLQGVSIETGFIETFDRSGYFLDDAGFYGSIKIKNNDDNLSDIKVVMPSCEYRSVTADDEFYFNGYNGAVLKKTWTYLSHLVNKELFVYSAVRPGPLENQVFLIDTDNGKAKKAFSWSSACFMLSYNTFYYGSGEGLYGYKFDYSTITYEIDSSGIGSTDPNNAMQVFFLAGAIDRNNTWDTWIVSSLNGEIAYTIVLKEVDGETIPVAVKVSEYVAEEQQIITLKPINR